ncbi:STAS domain-containing protein [Nocardioides rubriscoriae]|uniref:STAS domain-containing protein n=1 Tax=Nocardioides rubriscoriae TaxID=642762 RepID=UPI0014787E93|nr:STAS domain-containing protein [Nocardioides rubriscoriae]
MHPGSFSTDYDDAAHVLTVTGEVDETAAAELRDELDSRTEAFSRSLVLDLTAVTYLPSAAVGVLARAHQQATAAGQSLELRADEGSIAQRVLLVCGLPHRTA